MHGIFTTWDACRESLKNWATIVKSFPFSGSALMIMKFYKIYSFRNIFSSDYVTNSEKLRL